jgi:hypothetical protein
MRSRLHTIPAYGYSAELDTDRLAAVRRWSKLLDSQFQIPGTNFRFGLDPLVGLFLPGVGGVASSIVSLMLISTMMKHGASRNVLVRMLLNVLLDTTVGAIPILGNIFDFAFRANDRNVELLRRHYDEGKYQGSGWGLIIAVLGGIVVVCGLLLWGAVALVEAVWHAIR